MLDVRRVLLFAPVIAVATVTLPASTPLRPPSAPVAFPYDDGSWKIPLDRKAAELEGYLQRYHNIDGLYPSALTFSDGQPDLTTTGHADVSHAVVWTSYYFTAAVMRWKLTQVPADEARMRELFQALVQCEAVNGVPGLLSRGWVRGHGPTYEERRGDGRGQERWWQGRGRYADLRWRGSPSHHNYSAYFRALGLAWVLGVPEDMQTEIKRLARVIGDYVYAREDLAVVDVDGMVTARLLEYAPDGQPLPSVLMATSGMKVVAEATGDPAFARRYAELVARYHYREWARRPVEELRALVAAHTDHDDSDHVWGHLFNLVRLEKDPALLQFYRNYAEALWRIHGAEGQAYYNAMYHAVTGHDGQAGAVRTWLRFYPMNRCIQPRLNSLRTDLGDRAHPLPLSERPFDNEWNFKGDPWLLDGWQSRIVTAMALSAVDPAVRFAADSGGYLYRSMDGGRSWADAWAGLAGAKAQTVVLSPKKMEFVLAATDRGLFRSRDAGLTWTLVQAGNATALVAAPDQPDKLYAVIDGEVWEAVPLDPDYWGLTWRRTGGARPPALRRTFLVPQAGGMRFLAQDERGAMWSSQAGAMQWTLLDRPFGGRYEFRQLAGQGEVLLALSPSAKGLAVSADGGRSWQPAGGYRQPGTPWGEDLLAVAVDPRDSSTFYVGTTRHLWVSRDRGATWALAQAGLGTPAVHALTVSPVNGEVFAGTQLGLYTSRDGGRQWERGNLVPLFSGVQLITVGPADYELGYWSARYTGLLTEEQACAPW